MDDTVPFDKPGWVNLLVARHFEKLQPMDRLFDLSDSDTVKMFNAAVRRLGLPPLCMYQLRHGGASEDILSQNRPIHEVKTRGRWKTESSLRRYSKPAQVPRLLAALPPDKLVFARTSWERIEELMLRRRAPRLP